MSNETLLSPARGQELAAVWRLGWPTLVGITTSAGYQLLNAWFLGGLGNTTLAASLIALPLATGLMAIGQCLGAGAASFVSRGLGAGEHSVASRTASAALAVASVLALACALAIVLAAQPLLQGLGARGDVLQQAQGYLPWLMAAYALVVLNMVCGFIVRAEGNTLFSMKTQLLAFGSNAALDPVLIYTLDFGIQGAGMATVGGQLLALGLYAWHFRRHRGGVALSPATLTLPARRLGALVSIGLPSALGPVLASLAISVANHQASAGGDDHLAGFSLGLRLFTIATLPLLGLCLGSQAIFGYNLGAGRPAVLRSSLRALLRLELLVSIGALLLVGVASAPIARGFLADPAAAGVAAHTLRVVFLGLPFFAVASVATVYLQASGSAGRAISLVVLRQVVLLLPLLVLLPTTALPLAFPLAEWLTAGLALHLLYGALRRPSAGLPAVTPPPGPPRHQPGGTSG